MPTATITRFAGYTPRVNGIVVPCHPLPGGGYEGLTKRLDRAVMNAADWLKRNLNLPITVRFNSDRISGSAWLVDPKRQDASLGIGARLVKPTGVSFDEWRPNEQTPLRWSVMIHLDFLLDHSDLGEGSLEFRNGYWSFGNPRAAYHFVNRRLDRGRVLAALGYQKSN